MFVRRTWIFSVLVVLVMLKYITCDEDCDFECEENGSCIPFSSLCDGAEDCLHGSDESYVQCKTNATQKPNTFYCASGAEIGASRVNNLQVDCADKSDELPIKRDGQTDKCGEKQIMCTPGVCISEEKKCDGTVDCLNGRDESVELCMESCKGGFQCANGKCIKYKYLCDNNYDCIDGSDELERVCSKTVGWETKFTVKCKEPTENGLIFSDNTKYYKPIDDSRYVYPNMNVSFKCFDSHANMTGHKLNVCMVDGSWRFDLPSCIKEWVNLDPDTNGTNGCRIDTYFKYKNHLRIYNCGIDGNNCSQTAKPPINNMIVRFECESGYILYPTYLSSSDFVCRDKIWNSKPPYKDPSCVKFCNTDLLSCRDSMTPECYFNGIRLSQSKCYGSGSSGLDPSTQVKLKCKPGFRGNRNQSNFDLECQEDGNWRYWNKTNLDNYCTLDCGELEKQGLSRNTVKFNPVYSPWSVALFFRNEINANYKYICGGVLIRHNLVLTAAHCVCMDKTRTILEKGFFRVGPSNSLNSTVNSTFGWTVKKISINPQYVPYSFKFDTALIHIEEHENLTFPIICLPWLHNITKANLKVKDSGNVCLWDTDDINKSGKLNMTIVAAEVINATEHNSFRIRPLKGGRICKGDSGSGFISDCNISKKVNCLYGIVSSIEHGGSTNESCSNDISLANTGHNSNIDFINETIEQISNTCNQI